MNIDTYETTSFEALFIFMFNINILAWIKEKYIIFARYCFSTLSYYFHYKNDLTIQYKFLRHCPKKQNEIWPDSIDDGIHIYNNFFVILHLFSSFVEIII